MYSLTSRAMGRVSAKDTADPFERMAPINTFAATIMTPPSRRDWFGELRNSDRAAGTRNVEDLNIRRQLLSHENLLERPPRLIEATARRGRRHDPESVRTTLGRSHSAGNDNAAKHSGGNADAESVLHGFLPTPAVCASFFLRAGIGKDGFRAVARETIRLDICV